MINTVESLDMSKMAAWSMDISVLSSVLEDSFLYNGSRNHTTRALSVAKLSIVQIQMFRKSWL